MGNLNKKTIYIALLTLVLGFALGWLFFAQTGKNTSETQENQQSARQTWTCSMHPQIRQDEPGQCPLCGMELIPLANDTDQENPMEIRMSPTAMQLASIQTTIAQRQKPLKEVRMNGKVKANETKIFSQSSHIPGRVERLMVNFTGESVQQGQVLAYVYSPELLTAQEELFEAHKIKEEQPRLYQAAKEKLKNWKLTEGQIKQILEKGKIQEQFPILADFSGIVLHKKIKLGDYIQKGQSIYEIANLNTVWILFDVYESDIPWVKLGDKVTFSVQSLPSEIFTGKIAFIDPIIDPKTRVASARVELNNLGTRLKPEMFTQGVIAHPIQHQKEAIVLPKSAVMWTGERSVVYVKNANAKEVSFMMREITLGAALGDSYIINEGIEEGEEIAINGTFSIDAAAQLAGKPSMMSPEGGIAMTGHNHGDGAQNKPQEKKTQTSNQSTQKKDIPTSKSTKEVLKPLLNTYLALKDALVADDFEKALSETKQTLLILGKVDGRMFTGEAQNVWTKHSGTLEKELINASKAKDIEILRKSFKAISEQIVVIFKNFGSPEEPLFVDYCPMADRDKGANWLSKEKEIRNPYFGKAMLKCGENTATIK